MPEVVAHVVAAEGQHRHRVAADGADFATRGRVRGKETPIGWTPKYNDLNWQGLDFSYEQFQQLQVVDREAWKREVMGHEELFLLLHDHLPAEMIYERELLICRL